MYNLETIIFYIYGNHECVNEITFVHFVFWLLRNIKFLHEKIKINFMFTLLLILC